jgi:zinc protease
MSEANCGVEGPTLDRARPPAPGPLRPFSFPTVERRTLSNGVGVVVAEVHDFPVVTLSAILEAGGMRDDAELIGVASLTAALLQSGAAGRSAAEIALEIESLGVQLDSGAGWDTAHAGLTGLASRLEPATDVLTDLLREPSFPQDEVERLRAETLAGILQRRADPRSLASEVASRFIFAPETRTSRPLGGTPSTVTRLTRQDIASFHAQHFTPAAMNLVLVGDVRTDAAVEMLESRFGEWAGGGPPPLAPEVRPRAEDAQVVVVHRPEAVQSEIRIGHLGIARSIEDYFAVVVLNAILGGMFSSRLNLNLRERHGYTYGAHSSFTVRRQPGAFLVSTAVQTEVTAAAVNEILRELRGIREAPVSEDELRDARNYFAGVFPLRLQTTEGIAARLIELLVYDLPNDYYDSYSERVLAVSAQDVHSAALRYLHPDRLAVVVVGDATAIRDPLEALEVGPVQVIEPDEIRALD